MLIRKGSFFACNICEKRMTYRITTQNTEKSVFSAQSLQTNLNVPKYLQLSQRASCDAFNELSNYAALFT